MGMHSNGYGDVQHKSSQSNWKIGWIIPHSIRLTLPRFRWQSRHALKLQLAQSPTLILEH